jgi:hypothetical protein
MWYLKGSRTPFVKELPLAGFRPSGPQHSRSAHLLNATLSFAHGYLLFRLLNATTQCRRALAAPKVYLY